MRLTFDDVDMLAEKCGLTKRQFLIQSKTESAYWTSKSRGCDLIPHKTSEKIIMFAESKGINLSSDGITLNC